MTVACILCRKPTNWNPDTPWCPNEAAPGWMACHRCADRLAGALGSLADRYATLQDADELIPHGTGERGSPGFGPRSPAVDALLVHSDVRTRWTSEHGYGALAAVEQWARSIREDTSLDTPPRQMRNTVPAGRVTMSRELATIRFHWDYVLRSTWLGEFAGDMRDALHSLTMAGRLAERVMRVGPCPADVEVEIDDDVIRLQPCGAMLRVKANADEIRCPNCDTRWPRARWRELGNPWTDYASLAAELGVAVGTLWRWASEDDWHLGGTRGRRLVFRMDAVASYEKRRGPLTLEQAG